MTVRLGVWFPRTAREVRDLKHMAGCFGIENVEQHDTTSLTAASQHIPVVLLETGRGAVPLSEFGHPEHALYVVGPMNGTLPDEVLTLGRIVRVETARDWPLRPDVAAAIVLHDRFVLNGLR